MVASIKSFGKSTLAGLFAVAAMASAVPAFASTTTVTWDFFGGSGPNSDIGNTATFTGTPSVTGVNLGIQAAGYLVSTNVAGGQTTYSVGTAYDLYNKDDGASESGLGLVTKGYPSSDTKNNGMVDGEISDTSVTKYYQDNGHHRYKGESYGTGMIQLDISRLLSLATGSGAYITIGSLSTTSNDVAVFSGTNNVGQFGSTVGSPLVYTSSGIGSETLSLGELQYSPGNYYKYLNVSVAAPGQSVLLSTLSLTFPAGGGGAAPAPVPATAGLTLAGALGMGMMLLARRRRSML